MKAAAKTRRCRRCDGALTVPKQGGHWCRCAVRRKPGSRWRILAKGPKDRRVDIRSSRPARLDPSRDVSVMAGAVFDEVVIDDWLHIEQMDTRQWYARVGDNVIYVTLPRDPKKPPQITIHIGFHRSAGEPEDVTVGSWEAGRGWLYESPKPARKTRTR